MHFSLKSALFALFPLWAPKSHANPSTKQRDSAGSPNFANFLLKIALLEHLGHIGSHGCLAGWLRAEAMAEARAEAEEARAEARAETRARAEARARVTMGGLTHVHTHSPTLTLCG